MKTNIMKFMAFCIIMMMPFLSFSQVISLPDAAKPYMHNEVPDDPYLPNPYGNQKTSPAKTYRGTGFFTAQVNVNLNNENILGDAANEPSIGINPTNPNQMVIGWRQFDNVYSNFRQAGYAYSTDAGQTWIFMGTIETGIFRSDPVLDFDSSGYAYYNSLTSNSGVYTCKVFKSEDGGAIWNAGVQARGGDKQWMTIDRRGEPDGGNIYSFWTSYYSSCYPGFFTRSIDAGESFEWCSEIPGNPYWGTMAVGNNGELYIAGSSQNGGIVVVKSTNAWNTVFPGWDFYSEVDMDGYITSQVYVNPVGLLGQAYIDVDRSNGPGRGNVYVLASVVRFSNGDPADVMFSKSTDGGLTWSSPVKINDDPDTDRYQWFGTMSVAPNGRIDAVWLDTRDGLPGSQVSALYYSYSMDQGETWSPNERLSDLFDPHVGWPQQNKMGDYFDMKSDENGAHLAWANTLNDEQDVYYSYITPEITGIRDISNKQKEISLYNFPNPFRDNTTISYTITFTGKILMEITDLYGKVVETLVDDIKQPGTYHISWTSDIPAGYYNCRLTAEGQTKHTGLIKIR